MTTEDLIRLACAALAVVVVAFATAVLVGFTAVSRTRLADLATRDPERVRTVDSLLEASHRLQGAMTVLDTLAVAVAVALVTATVARRLDTWAEGLVVVGTVSVVVIFGRAVPRAIALRLPEEVALRFVRLARIAVVVLSPLTGLLDTIARGVIAALRLPSPSATTSLATEEELIQLVRDEAGDNRIEASEVSLVNSIFRFTDTVVREIMVPRVDISGVPRGATVAQAIAAARETGHSRLPVYEESLDSIVGVVYVKDLLRFVGRASADAPIFAIMRQPLFVPDSKPVADLLRDLQARRVHLAVVVDEYGGTAGLVTIEDILEEIVGEIQDEYDAEPPLAQSLPDGAYLVSARLSVADVARLVGTGWPTEDEEREPVAAILYDRFGHIPEDGESIAINGLRFTVAAMDNQRIESVRVETLPDIPELASDDPGADVEIDRLRAEREGERETVPPGGSDL